MHTKEELKNYFGRYLIDNKRIAYARIDGDYLHLLKDAPWLIRPTPGETSKTSETIDTGETVDTGEKIPLSRARALAPLTPGKIIGIGRNYLSKEQTQSGMNRNGLHSTDRAPQSAPLFFLKPPSSIIGPEGIILLPRESSRVHYEAELGVVISKRARRISPQQAMSHVFGYTGVGDITAADLMPGGEPWSRAKGFDTFCPVGPCIVSGINPDSLEIRSRLNSQTRQSSNTANMIFNVAEIISHLSQTMTLEPGDLISTGTPEGVGKLEDGDVFEIEIESIGTLRVRAQNEQNQNQ